MDFVFNFRTKAFWMDDLKWLASRTDGDYKTSVDFLKARNTPIISSKRYPEYKFTRLYPLMDILDMCRIQGVKPYFNNSAPWLIALAIFWGFQEIHLHGLDYLADHEGRDAERACTEYWVGIAESQGIKVRINPASFLCDTNGKFVAESLGKEYRPYYGYYPQIGRAHV